MFLFRFSKACSTDTSDRSCNQPSLQRLKNVFCKIKEALVLEILNNCFEADVLKSIGRQTEWLHNQKSKKKKDKQTFFSLSFFRIIFNISSSSLGCMSESAARLIYSTQRRLNVVISEDLFSHCSKSSTRLRVYSSIQSISLPF